MPGPIKIESEGGVPLDFTAAGKNGAKARVSSTPYLLDILEGNINGHTFWTLGASENNTQTTNELISHVDDTILLPSATALRVASTDDTKDDVGNVGALTVRVTGISPTTYLTITEDFTLTGQTFVQGLKSFLFIQCMEVLTAGSSGYNEGTIYVGTGSFTAGVPAVVHGGIYPDHNVSNCGIYMVPEGETLYLAEMDYGAVGGKDADIHVYKKEFGGLQKLLHHYSVNDGAATATPMIKYPAKSQLILTSHTQSAGGTISVNLFGWLEDED